MTTTTLSPENISLTETQQLTKGKLLQPSWLPSTGLALTSVVVYMSNSSSSGLFATTLKYKEAPTNWVIVTQFYGKITRHALPVNSKRSTIRGYPAVFTTELVPSNVRSNGLLRVASCAWDAEFPVEIIGADLSYLQLVQIVESLV